MIKTPKKQNRQPGIEAKIDPAPEGAITSFTHSLATNIFEKSINLNGGEVVNG